MKSKILVITGPTASGKKRISLQAAEKFNGEIISADSRKVYRHLNIGTAKPSADVLVRTPHHLIDIVDPDEPFNAGEWMSRATDTVKYILGRAKLPIISGGTGFYISAFCEGLSEGITPNPEIRCELQHELDEKGAEAMYNALTAVDPVRAAELHLNDTFRVMRALEIYQSSGGQTFESLRERNVITGGEYDIYHIGISMPRDTLYTRINKRVDSMVKKGVVDELKAVLDSGCARDLVSLDTVGYKEWFPYLDGVETFEVCLEKVKRNTRRYAKRQMTWCRGKESIRWYEAGESELPATLFSDVEYWLNNE